jgi:hypothetical protein
MKISELKLRQEINNWEIRRASRLKTEKQFEKFTGLVHGVELHIPYTCWEYAYDMCKEAKNYDGKKILLSGGDSVNLDAVSFFYKRGGAKRTVVEELTDLIKFLKYAQTIYDKIIFLESNHEQRLKKFIYRALDDRGQAKEVESMMKTLKQMFDDEGLDKVVFTSDFFFQVGDIVFNHFENNSTVPGTIMRNVIQYLYPRIKKEWNMVVSFHTHAQGLLPIDRKIAIENGCIAQTMDYWRSGKMLGKGKAISIGYGHYELNKGKAEINKCRPIICDWEGWM